MAILDNNQKIDIDIKRNLQFSLNIRYNFFEFENIKFLLGINFAYQFNSLNIKYNENKLELVNEESKKELDVGQIIDNTLINKCNINISGDNISIIPETGEYIVTGKGVYCFTYTEVEKIVEYPKNVEIMKATLPIFLNFTIIYGLTNNLDLGLVTGINLIESLNINYTDKSFKINTKQSISSYNIGFLINYKL